jgi:hypothetical protein
MLESIVRGCGPKLLKTMPRDKLELVSFKR